MSEKSASTAGPLQTTFARLAMVALAALLAFKVGGSNPGPTTSPTPGATAASSIVAPAPDRDVGIPPQDVRYLEPLANSLDVTAAGADRDRYTAWRAEAVRHWPALDGFFPPAMPPISTEDALLAALQRKVIPPTSSATGSAAPGEGDVEGREVDMSFVIVTLPDPQLAGTDLLTDALLETVRRSIETPERAVGERGKELLARGPILDRYWLPWSDKPPKDFTDFARGNPGVLVFRELRLNSYVVVLVVGEHPAMGIDRGAMRKALQLVNKLQQQGRPIRILGPTFTGSEASFVRAIREDHAAQASKPKRDYRVVNGSATALHPNEFATACWPAKVNYSATIIPDRDLQDDLLDFLVGNAGPAAPRSNERVAFLVESDTGYGQNVAAGLKAYWEKIDVVTIPFPMNVSRVLSTYQASRLKATEQLPRLQSSELQVSVPLQTRDMTYRRMQPYEPDLAAVRVDLLLREITRSIREQKIHYVGVIATNSLDKLYLASLIRQACPNVRLFATTGEISMTHAEVSGDLTGMVVASTYPMVRSNQTWTGPNLGHIQAAFGHQSELGVYNAMQVLLDKPERMMEYAQAFGAHDPQHDRPPIWISVVGRDAIYPLRCYDVDDISSFAMSNDQGQQAASLQARHAEVYRRHPDDRPTAKGTPHQVAQPADRDASWQWFLLFFAAAVTSMAHSVWTIRRLPDGQSRVNAFGALANGVLAVFWLVAVWLLRGGPWSVTYIGAVKVACLAALLVSTTALGAWAGATFIERPTANRQTHRPAIMAALAAAIAAAILAALSASWQADVEMFDLLRVVNFKGGVSPLAPLGLWTLAAAALALAHARLVRGCRALLDLNLPKIDALHRLSQEIERLKTAAVRPWQTGGEDAKLVRVAPFVAVALLLGLPATWDLLYLSSLDKPWHGRLCAALYVLTIALISWHAWWLAALGNRLRHVLLELSALPSSLAFGRLPRAFGDEISGGLFGWISSSPDRLMTILEQQKSVLTGKPLSAHAADSHAARWGLLDRQFRVEIEKLARDYWPQQAIDRAFGAAVVEAPPDEPAAKATTWRARQAEVFVAGMLFTYVVPYLVQLRRLATGVLIAALAFVLATWSYPFIPQTSLQLSAWAIVLIVAYRIFRIAVQLNKDEVLSHATGGKAHELTWNTEFTGVVLTYIGPVVALVLYSFFGLPAGVLEWLSGFTGR